MDVTYKDGGYLTTRPLAALQFPVLLATEDASPGRPTQAPALSLLRSPSASAGTSQTTDDISVVSSSRIVELHVQAQGDSALSYAQTLRGVPCPAPPRPVDGAAPCPPAGTAESPQAFMIRIPVSEAYPDWRVFQLRFASARAALGGVCSVYDIQLLPAHGAGAADAAAVAADAISPAGHHGGDSTAVAAATIATQAIGASQRELVAAADAAGAAAGMTAAATSGDGPGAAVLPYSTSVALTASPSPSQSAHGGTLGDGVLSGGAEHTAGAPASALAPVPAPAPAMGSQMQQLRELLQRAAASVPPPQPVPSADGSATTHGSSAVPSAAKANLSFAATLARSLLHGQSQAGAGAQTAAPANAVTDMEAGATTSRLPNPPAAAAAASPAGALTHQQQQQPQQQPGSGAVSAWPAAPASGGFGAGVGFPQLPLTGLLSSGPLATAAAQLADVSARVRRIEEHLLGPAGGPTVQNFGQVERNPPAGGGGGGGGSGAYVSQPRDGAGAQPQEHQRRQLPADQDSGEQATRQQRAGDVLNPPSQPPPSQPPPAPPFQALPQARAQVAQPSQAAAAPSQTQLLEQLLAALPSLTAGMVRLEAAVTQQGAQLGELSKQIGDVQRRLDSVVRVSGPATELVCGFEPHVLVQQAVGSEAAPAPNAAVPYT